MVVLYDWGALFTLAGDDMQLANNAPPSFDEGDNTVKTSTTSLLHRQWDVCCCKADQLTQT